MGWNIIAGKCLHVLPTIESGSSRLVSADPPYNRRMNYSPDHDDDLAPEAYLAWSEDWIRATVPLLTADGSVWLIISHEWDWRLIPLAIGAGLHLRQRITWYEPFGVNTTRKLNRCSRALLWFTRQLSRFVFND
jgi:DNA modification methylase